jgi:hypothetical protein
MEVLIKEIILFENESKASMKRIRGLLGAILAPFSAARLEICDKGGSDSFEKKVDFTN